MPKISPFLWFEGQAQPAAEFYVSIFPNSRITAISYYGQTGPGSAGSVMTVSFELDGSAFTALNAGPQFKFNEAVSFVVHCRDQAEVDHYWQALGAGGQPNVCGWLKDRYGLSWQITPDRLIELICDPDEARAGRAMAAMMQMTKIDIAALERAVQ